MSFFGFLKKGIGSLGTAVKEADPESVTNFAPKILSKRRESRNAGITGAMALAGQNDPASASFMANTHDAVSLRESMLEKMQADVVSARGAYGKKMAEQDLHRGRSRSEKSGSIRRDSETEDELIDRFRNQGTNFFAHRVRTIKKSSSVHIEGNNSAYNNPRLRPSPQVEAQRPLMPQPQDAAPPIDMSPVDYSRTMYNGSFGSFDDTMIDEFTPF